MRILPDVGESLGADEVNRRLDGSGQALRGNGEPDRHGGPLGKARQRGTQPALGQHHRMDPCGQLLQLALRRIEFSPGIFQPRGHRSNRSSASSLEAEVHEFLDLLQPLPGAGPQLLLETAALSITGRKEPAPRGGQLRDLAPHLGPQPHVRKRNPGRRSHRVHQAGIVQHRGVVDERSDSLALLLDHGDRLPRPRAGERHRVPALVDISAGLWEPVRDRQRPVAQRMR